MSRLLPEHFEYVRTMVRERAGIVLEDGKEYLVETRLSALARRHEGVELADLVEQALKQTSSPINDEIVDAMTTNETSFFRDIHPFNTLKAEILPRLIERRQSSRRIHILSGAASTGQEAYSIAMLIRQNFPELASWDVSILGTDISKEALAKARSGRYTQLEINRGLPATMLRYFRQDGREFVIDDALRSMVRFQELNLVTSWPLLPPADVVMLRNVLIYFDTQTKRDILARVRKVLAPDGLLFLGASETTLNLDDSYQSVRLGQSTAYALASDRSGTWHSAMTISAT